MVLHLQFADDTILFLDAERDNIRNTEKCFNIFKGIFGLKVNLNKSSKVGVHVE